MCQFNVNTAEAKGEEAMKKTQLIVTIAAICGLFTAMTGCSEYRNVPPQAVGRKLTPTGWEDKLYGSGQVNIGEKGYSGLCTNLVIIQTSAFAVKESFLGAQANPDHEDHRVFTLDKTPMSLDIRLMFTCPDVNRNEEAVKRLFTLSNPVQKQGDDRVMEISLASIYAEQAQMHVRGKIRDVMARYKSFDHAFDSRSEITQEICSIVASVFKERNVSLALVDGQISNMKPDPLVWENQVKVQAANAEIEAMTKLQKYLDENPSGRIIFVLSKLKEIASIGAEKGNTVVVISALGEQSGTAFLQAPAERVAGQKK